MPSYILQFLLVSCVSNLICEVRSDQHRDFHLPDNFDFEETSDLTASLNTYLDKLLAGANTHISYPIIIPDYNVSVHTVILVVPVFANFKFFNAQVKEIGTISRTGDAVVKYNKDILTITLSLQAKNVKFSGNFVAKLEALGPSGSMRGNIEQLKAEAALSVNVKTLQITVTDFEMDTGTIDLSVKVLPVLDWFLNSLIKLIITIIEWPLLNIISSDIKGQLQQFFNSYTEIFL